jgi:signal transduction histidine kinase/DNA-binding response OmpR family regulator
MDNDTFHSATDISGNIWIGTEYGIFVIDGRHYTLLAHYEQSFENTSLLNDSPIYSIYKDRNNNMWIGTYFGGVNYYIYGSDQFHIYSYGNTKNQLSGKAVRQIIGDPTGGMYIATEDGGLNYMDRYKNIIRSNIIHAKLGINAKNVHSLKYTQNKSLWIGLFSKGVINYTPNTGSSIKYDSKDKDFASAFFLIEGTNNNIIYGGPNGLFLISKNNNSSRRFSDIASFCSLRENDESYLIGTRRNGIYRLNTNTLKLSKLNLLPYNNLFITNIYKDYRYNLWIGTNNNGLFIINREHRLIKAFDKEILGSNGIKGIIEDRMHNIWIGTDNGLILINSKNLHLNRYTIANGLPTNQFNYSSAYMNKDGELFFGTINGMVSFYPEMIKTHKQHFNVKITNIVSNSLNVSPTNKEFKIENSASDIQKITLTNSQAQSLMIEYSGMNYQYGSNTYYAMYMEGLDEGWQYVGKQHQVRFSNLSAGNYTLKIKASSNGIDWDEQGIKLLKIKVLPPWWLSPWAYIFYLILLVLGLYMGYKYTKSRLLLIMRLNTEHEQRINIEKLNKQKTDFFAYISHDIKTPLTLILSPLHELISKNEINNTDKKIIGTVYRNANRMNYLIDELLTFSKIEMKQMHINVRKGDIINFLRDISSIFDVVSSEKDIEFILNLEDTRQEVWFSPSKLERIMYNLLSNAFKYSQAGDTVTLSARLETKDDETKAIISVKDTGRGIPKDRLEKIFDSYYQVDPKDNREGFGLGLALTRSLLQMHKGSIKVESEVGIGSEFIVTLDVSDKAYTDDEKLIEGITKEEVQKYNKRMRDTIELIPDKLIDKEKNSDEEIIMIVEDNKEMNEYLYEIFRNRYSVMRAYNGEEAYKMLAKRIPSIIITDVMMPKMNGLELTKLVKQNVNTSHIPVILLTAKTDENDYTEGYQCGAEAYISKPFNARNLELLIENLENNRRKIIKRFKETEEMNITQITNNPRDEKFMKELVELIMTNISQEDFGVTEIITRMRISRSLLHTKLKSLTGCSITQFMRTIRMKEAKTHLINGMNVSEASYAVGMSDPNYFTKCFKKEFNVTPTEFLKQIEPGVKE